jgi:Replication-relaxation
MTGTNKSGMLLQPRDRTLLSALGQIRIVDRELAKVIAGFHSNTRSNARLLTLTRAGFLNRFFLGTTAAGRKAIYTLTPKGAALIETQYRGIKRKRDENLVGDLFVEHQLLIAELFVIAMCRNIPEARAHTRNWRTFPKPPVERAPLIPDAYFEVNTQAGIRPQFLEVDRGTEILAIWKKKIDGYLQIAVSGNFTRIFGQAQFRVLIITLSERRLQNLRTQTAKTTEKLFWFTTFDLIRKRGFWAPIWLRPVGNEPQSLL